MNIRKILPFGIALTLLATGCADNGASNRAIAQTTGVKDVLESAMAEEDSKNGDAASSEAPADNRQAGLNEDAPVPESVPDQEAVSGENIDIDLTVLSADMVYAEVYSMLYVPEEYIGKTVKMAGQFVFYHDEANDKYYYACFITDAAACCSQGIEFVPADESITIDDLPEAWTDICVTGVFDTYQEEGKTYCTLRDAKLI